MAMARAAPFFVLAAFVLHNVAAMKLHDVSNRTSGALDASDCRLGARKFVDSLGQDLNNSLGFDGMFYQGCLRFLEHNAKSDVPMMAQIEAFAQRCKQGLFVEEESSIGKVDPQQLEAECDRAVLNMDVQFRLLGAEAMSTPQEFCAVFVDMVLPLDEEPECMRFIEDITRAHSQFVGTSHAWTAIIKKPHFEEAFMQACLESKKLESEEDGVKTDYGDGAKDCELKMNRLQAMPLDKHYKHLSEFFADVCPMLGKELPDPNGKSTPLQKTSRSFKAALFQRAAQLVAERGNGTVNTTRQAKRKKSFSALQVHLDKSVSGKSGRRRRRRRRRLNHRQATCCDEIARTYEVGITASAGVAVGYTQVGAEGWDHWRGNDCIYKWGIMGEVCAGLQIGAGIDVGVSNGYFKGYNLIAGEAHFKSGGICWFGCGGGSLIETKLWGGQEIGKVIETGAGFGVDLAAGYCKATPQREWTRRIRRLKRRCPRKSGGCFPGHAVVRTTAGSKFMRDLRAGDRVEAVDEKGDVIYDDIYFFGHAEAEAWMAFIRLQLREASNTSTPAALELTPDHFIQICETQTCRWEDRRTVPAERVLVGQWVWVLAPSPSLRMVVSTEWVPHMGLYNPYTLSGNIVVNGVVASSHSSWLLDPWVPEQWQEHLPAIYQQIFVLGRVVYWFFGPIAADVIGVNNNREVTKDATWSAHALALLAVLGAAVQGLMGLSLVVRLGRCLHRKVAAKVA